MKDVIIITNPMIAANKSAEVTLSKFIRVISPSFKSVEVIGGNLSLEKDLGNVALTSFPIVRHPNKLKRLLSIIALQLKMGIAILCQGKRKQPVYFWIADKMVIPYIIAKLKGMEVNYFIYGNVEKEGSNNKFTVLSGKLIRYMALYADYVCMESASVAKEWPLLKIKKKKIIHLYTELIEKILFDKRKNIFGMVCRLTQGKHVIECIHAMAELHNIYPQWKLEIVGSGKQQRECEILIDKLNASEYISLIGWIEHDKLIDVVKSWKYLLYPTDTEGMPNGIVEMMGAGIPAIASPVGGISDIIDLENGYLITGYSIKDIKNEMEKAILSSDELYIRKANNAYNTISREFTLDVAQFQAKKWL